MSKTLDLLSAPARPGSWKSGKHTKQLEKKIEEYFETNAFLCDSGRSAIYLFLKSIGIEPGDEIIIQSYTCNAVPNPVLWAGAKPVYVDIETDTLNTTADKVAEKITSKTKAIIVQHTLGRAAPIEEIIKIAKNWGIFVLEDCAHSLGGSYKGQKLGSFGDGAIISFGREKVISSLTGGALLVNNPSLKRTVQEHFSDLPVFNFLQISKELFNFFSWRALLRKIYFNQSGQTLIKALNSFDFFNVVTAKKELFGKRPAWRPSQYPDVLAKLALTDWGKIEKNNRQRKEIAQYYYQNLKNKDFKLLPEHDGVWLRVVALHKDASEILKEAKKRKMWFGNWYNSPIYPAAANEEKLGYDRGSCPNAEKAASQTLNLPNYIGMSFEEAQKIVDFLNNWK